MLESLRLAAAVCESACSTTHVRPIVHAHIGCAGKMELHSASFFPAVLAALDTPGLVVLGTVPVSRQVRWSRVLLRHCGSMRERHQR